MWQGHSGHHATKSASVVSDHRLHPSKLGFDKKPLNLEKTENASDAKPDKGGNIGHWERTKGLYILILKEYTAPSQHSTHGHRFNMKLTGKIRHEPKERRTKAIENWLQREWAMFAPR